MNSGHGKRNAYTTDFKIKVLEHYMKNGGEKVFGLKTKTALHFNIGKKTVHRIVDCKQDLLRAKATKSKKPTAPAGKSLLSSSASKAVSSKAVGHKAIVPKAIVPKAIVPKAVSGHKIVAAAKTSTNNSTASASNCSSLPPKAVAALHSNKTAKLVSKASVSSLSKSSSGKTTTKEVISNAPSRNDEEETSQSHEEEEVLDLPEDPDFSVLKLPIAGGVSATGVAGPAMLLSTATDEVRHALVHECELLYECRVCRNLFRSVVNFLAHKRIFCTQHYSENRSFYPEGQASQFTPQSSTVMDDADNASDGKGGVRVSHRQRTSAAKHTGSSEYYTRLAGMERDRATRSKDCSVSMQGIAGNDNALYQTFRHPDQSDPSQPSLQRGREMVRIHEHGVMAILNEHGAVTSTVSLDGSGHLSLSSVAMETVCDQNCAPDTDAIKTEMKEEDELEELEDEEEEGEGEEIEEKNGSFVCTECGRIFAGAKYLRTHLKNVHGAERTVFSCPICDGKFLSLWATGKHLQKTHNKTKSQIDHLRNTIKKNSYKEKNVRVPGKAAGKTRPDVNLNNNNNNNNNDDSNVNSEDGAVDTSVEIKKEIDDEMLETEAPFGDDEESEVEGMMGGGVQKGMVLSKRWMCNVCRKLHVTHTASLAHAATHTDCTFLPKPQLVQVILNRKAFSKPILPPSYSISTADSATDGSVGGPKQPGDLQGPGDLVLPDSVVSSEDIADTSNSNLVRLKTGTVVTTISSGNASSSTGVNALRASNGIIDISDDSSMTEIEVSTSDHSKVALSRNSAPALSDNVAFTISRTNNLSWRDSNIPFQSLDQKSALERSIERIYKRQKGCNQPKVHEILLQRRQSIKNINKDSTTNAPSQRSVPESVTAGTNVSVRETVSRSKRKLNMAMSSYATKISKFSLDDTIHRSTPQKSSKPLNFTGLIGGKVSSASKVDQRNISPVRANKTASSVNFNSFSGGKPRTMPVSASEHFSSTSLISPADQNVSIITTPSETKLTSLLTEAKLQFSHKSETSKSTTVSLNLNATSDHEVKSPQPCSSKTALVSQQESDSSKSKVWSIFEADWDDDGDEDDTELLSLGATGTKSPELPDITGGKSNDANEACGTSRVLSPGGDSASKHEFVKTPDSVPSSTWNKSNSYDLKVASNTPSVRSEEISSDSWSSSIVSFNEERTKYEHSGSYIQSAQEETSLSTKGETSSSNKVTELKTHRKQTDPVSVIPSKRPVRLKNQKTIDESALTFKLKSHFSHFIEQRASSVILDRRKTETDCGKSTQSSPGRKHFAGFLDRSALSRPHGKSDSTFQSFSKTSNSGHRPLSYQPLASHLAKKAHPLPKSASNDEDDMKLFDCGSMAEQAYDATKDSASISSKSPDVLEISPDTDCSRVTNTCVTPDTAPLASTSAGQGDTVLTTASNLGLFDTGFEECRLHVVEDREIKEEATEESQDSDVTAGPSRIASDHR